MRVPQNQSSCEISHLISLGSCKSSTTSTRQRCSGAKLLATLLHARISDSSLPPSTWARRDHVGVRLGQQATEQVVNDSIVVCVQAKLLAGIRLTVEETTDVESYKRHFLTDFEPALHRCWHMSRSVPFEQERHVDTNSMALGVKVITQELLQNAVAVCIPGPGHAASLDEARSVLSIGAEFEGARTSEARGSGRCQPPDRSPSA